MLVDARRGVAVEVREFQQAALVARHEGHGGSGGSCTAAFAVFVLQGDLCGSASTIALGVHCLLRAVL